MIDCENEVYTRIARVLRDKFPGINIAGEYVNAPSSFPHVSITQSDNSVVSEQMTGSAEMAQVMFEINIYSNKADGRKTECKSIAKVIDDVMFKMNFKRIALTPIPNMEDATIYRIVARYRVMTDGKYFYRR
ncbi:hypothetical protein [Intestinimonas butyriciproducens]|uniref:hypothetical protein n=1 Tax=Intestinimonas butyriciproducens TaxID=1297617 RepID=UPI00242A61AA|nr:hypothetical protein [Intestinimonas butyriciproducens]MCI6363778.1 hypothetical protein [Intestinimonas butyriciproducens]